MKSILADKWPWLITLVGILASLLLYQWLSDKQVLMQQASFERRADNVINGIQRRLDGNVQVLHGVRGLIVSSSHVSRSQFKSFYESLQIEELYPGIQGIGFAQWIAPSNLSKHVEGIRAEGFPSYKVWPETIREQYSSIVYLEPFDWRNQRALGFDMFSEATRQSAMRRSVETNQPALSDKVTLVQETQTDVQAGFLVYTPVYKQNMPLSNADERWRALYGWAYSPLRAKDLVDSLLASEFNGLHKELNLRIFSSATQDPQQLLYQSAFEDRPEAKLKSVSQLIDVYGVQWLVVASPQETYWHDVEADKNYRYMLMLRIIFSVAIGWLLSVLTHRNQRISMAHRQTVSTNQKLEENEESLRLAASTNQELEANEVSLRLAGVVMQVSPTGIFVADGARRIIAVNPSFTSITGFSDAQVLGQQVDFMIARHAVADHVSSIWTDLDETGLWQGELSFRRPDGSLYPSEVSITRVDYGQDQGSQYVGMFTDISVRRKDEERIRFLAHHDYLTGLPNRALFVDRAEQALVAAVRYGHKPVLIFIDLDRFKPINDECGHDVGDAVLKAIAQRLQDQVRQSDFICRLGGDEFVVMLPDHDNDESVMVLAEQLLKKIEEPYTVGAFTLSLSASMGIASYPVHGETLDQLIQRADAAMYQAKADKQQRIRMASSG